MSRPARTFADVLIEHGRELMRLQKREAETYLRYLREVRAELYGHLATLPGGRNPFDAVRLAETLAHTESAIATLERRLFGAWQAASRRAAELAIRHLAAEVRLLSPEFDIRPLETAMDARAILSDPTQELLANKFRTSVRRYGLDLLGRVQREAAMSMGQGLSLAQFVERLKPMIAPNVPEVGFWARRLGRTEISESYGRAQFESGKAWARSESAAHARERTRAALERRPAPKPDPIVSVWWHTSSYPCKVCVPIHATERPLGGAWTVPDGKRTRRIVHAPAHPNCTCRTLFLRRSWLPRLRASGTLSAEHIVDVNGREETRLQKPMRKAA